MTDGRDTHTEFVHICFKIKQLTINCFRFRINLPRKYRVLCDEWKTIAREGQNVRCF